MGTEWDGIQLADIHVGLLNVALSGAIDNDDCAENLLLVKRQLYRSGLGQLLGYGVKVMAGQGASFVTDRCWWKKWNTP